MMEILQRLIDPGDALPQGTVEDLAPGNHPGKKPSADPARQTAQVKVPVVRPDGCPAFAVNRRNHPGKFKTVKCHHSGKNLFLALQHGRILGSIADLEYPGAPFRLPLDKDTKIQVTLPVERDKGAPQAPSGRQCLFDPLPADHRERHRKPTGHRPHGGPACRCAGNPSTPRQCPRAHPTGAACPCPGPGRRRVPRS